MNTTQRNKLHKISGKMDYMLSQLDIYKTDIETILEEEQGKFDNMSEGRQESELGCRIYERNEALEELVNRLDDLIDELSDISCDTEHITEM